MIYLLSDLHGDIEFSGLKEYLNVATDQDLLIILGDIGLNFEKTKKNREFTEFFLSIKKNIVFIDGNHENFGYLHSFPEEEWNGGIVGRLSPNILHLKRGNFYEIEGKTFFVFGGCKSSSKWKEMGLWYPEEEPSEEEYNLAYDNLKAHGYCADYILTHKYEQNPEEETTRGLAEFTRFIEDNVSYKKWYSGHWHKNIVLDEKHIFIYDKLHAL